MGQKKNWLYVHVVEIEVQYDERWLIAPALLSSSSSSLLLLLMVIGLSGVQFGLNHTSDYQNQTTTKWESDLLIMSMIADRIQWHEVLLPINHKHYNFRKNKNTSTSTNILKGNDF